ncbi:MULTISPECIES: urea ABC transporter ATP-binding protein UrtD [Roseateles]|uniref:Urea ABC transporter ATP-binding protein UrtD n=1 Tax=Pelomonas caseinilytica TaxID=2906763 RepID=A0ABS8XDV5_9BURK|nr:MULTISPECIES: urea ABC transporter ATP-binding protein UrtD [unclassified Roseateles]MCE4537016.1 urea ABC transporter ATP-binding protein UrtD [Pelomonas sp. P7]HEV6965745.1 urea ABC transporter ATP-binding protein UrtD [Roseateles sp.]
MTPELLEAGAEARSRAITRIATAGEPIFNQGVALYVEDLKVAFDGFQALGGLSFTVGVGELRCVIGPNGAGKTTTMDCITGKTRPDSGRIYFGSNLDLRTMNEAQIARAGIGRKFQKPTVFEALTVAENLELALAGDRRARFAMRARLTGEQRDRLDELLKTVHLAEERTRLAGLLSHGQKQWLEIGMLLAQDPKLLLLDEPVAGMTDEETERTAELFLSLEGQHSLVVVEHDMAFVGTLAGAHRTVTVLHEGRTLAEGTMAAVQSDEKVIEVYLGR